MQTNDGFAHFTPGQVVEVLVDKHRDIWRRARVERDAPYPKANTGGAYILWDFGGREPRQWESSGGWHAAHSIREVVGECTCAVCG
jgi:hypothetical protein